MKKVKSELTDEVRPEYQRSDFGEMVRGKYAHRIKEKSNVVLLDPDIAEALSYPTTRICPASNPKA